MSVLNLANLLRGEYLFSVILGTIALIGEVVFIFVLVIHRLRLFCVASVMVDFIGDCVRKRLFHCFFATDFKNTFSKL